MVNFPNSLGRMHIIILLPVSRVSAARLRLTQEETAEAEGGKVSLDKVSASVFVRIGLELEDQQYGSGFYDYFDYF